MKRELSIIYHKTAGRLRSTPISEIPGIKILHRAILKSIKKLLGPPETHQWITYDGCHLYINPRDYVSERLYYTGQYEPMVSDKIDEILEDGDTAVDIGGHIGHHSITMRNSVGEHGYILIFEPHPKNADNIRKTINRNNWGNVELFEKALSNNEREKVLLENPTNTGASSIKTKREMQVSEYEVETIRLSELLSAKNIDCIKLMKIDIEGGEVEVIEDIRDLLEDIESIILEIHGNVLSDSDMRAIYEILSSEGNIWNLSDESVLSANYFSNKNTIFNVNWRNK